MGYAYNEQDQLANASSQGTPTNYDTSPPATYTSGYDQREAGLQAANAAQARRPMAQPRAPGVVGMAATDPDNPGSSTPVDQPMSRGVPGWWDKPVSEVMRSVSSASPFTPPSGPLTVATSAIAGSGRTGDDRSAGAGSETPVFAPAPKMAKPLFTSDGSTAENQPVPQVQPYGATVGAANLAMANNYSDRLAAEDARRPNSLERDQANNDARIARFRATDGADMVLAGGNKAYAGQRAAIVQNAADATANATRLDNAARAASGITPPNLVQGAVAQTEADAKARSGAFDLQKGGIAVQAGKQGLQKGALDIKSQQAHLDAVNALQNATPGSPQALAAERTLLAIQGKLEPGWKAQVVGGGIDPETGLNRPGSVLFYNQSTGENSMHSGTGEQLGGQAKPQYTKGEQRMDPATKKVYTFDGKDWKTN